MTGAIGAVLDAMVAAVGEEPEADGALPPHADELLGRFQRERSSPAQMRVNELVLKALGDRLP